MNLSSLLAKSGILDYYGVKVIGVNMEAIERGEDRTAFKEALSSLGIETPKSKAVNTIVEAEKIASELGYPVVIRPAYTMGGTGSGLVYNIEELRTIVSRGLSASMVGQVLVEESVLGWEELELQLRLQKYSYDIVEGIGVIGGANVQFAHNPETGRVVVIEINPRTSRSSALASKATGFPCFP